MSEKAIMSERKKEGVNRREFLLSAAALGITAGASTMAGCSPQQTTGQSAASDPVSSGSSGSGAQPASDILYTSETFDDLYLPEQVGEIAFVAEPIPDSEIMDTWECELLIAGCGMAGLATYASATENGVNTILIEKSSGPSVKGGQFNGIGSRLLKSFGMDVDPDIFLQEAVHAADFRCNVLVWKQLMKHVGKAVDWLEGVLGDTCGAAIPVASKDMIAFGINWRGCVVTWEEGMRGIVDRLIEYGAERGGVIHFDTPAVQLIQEADGSVSGAIAKTADGYVRIKASKGVALATGSYEYNLERMERYVSPRFRAVQSWVNPALGCTGDGHEMGRSVGGTEDDMPHVLMLDPGVNAVTHSGFSASILPLFRVNAHGERFMNEAVAVNYMANAIISQKGARCWSIVDGDYESAVTKLRADAPYGADAKSMYENYIKDCVSANTLEELATICGINAENFVRSVERYNELVDKGVDEDFFKTEANLYPIKTPPFYAFEEGATCLVSVSGLRVNTHSKVLRSDETPIEGLYAIGNCSGSMFVGSYPHHLAGVSMGRCLTFGYLLGRRLVGISD